MKSKITFLFVPAHIAHPSRYLVYCRSPRLGERFLGSVWRNNNSHTWGNSNYTGKRYPTRQAAANALR